jgi:hypothetical protein
MTEDDTFNALRRAPFNELVQSITDYIDTRKPLFPVDTIGALKTAIESGTKLQDEVIQIIKCHGYTNETILSEINKKYCEELENDCYD